MSGTVGFLSEYKPGDDWEVYSERLEQYMLANKIEDDEYVAVLLTAIGPQVYKTLRDLCDPKRPKELKYKELVEILSKQFSPSVPVIRKRIEFYDMKQAVNESINNWYVRIKDASTSCKFGKQLEDKLKDKFISGLLKGPILDRLCEEDAAKNLNHFLDLAVKKESIMHHSEVGSEVNFMKWQSNKKGPFNQSGGFKK